MSYWLSSGSVPTMLCAVIIAQLYFMATTVDAGYTPAGQCVWDNRCFDRVEIDYSQVVMYSPFKVLEIPKTKTSSQVDFIRVYFTESCKGSYYVDTQIFMKGKKCPKHNEYTQVYNGKGYVDEWGSDALGNRILFPIRILHVDCHYCMVYYRCQQGHPEAPGDTLYICCPEDVDLSCAQREKLKKKAFECGFQPIWETVE